MRKAFLKESGGDGKAAFACILLQKALDMSVLFVLVTAQAGGTGPGRGRTQCKREN